MKEETLVFLNASKSMLENSLKKGGLNEGWIKILKEYAAGRCPCGAILEVLSFQKTAGGAKWSFKCGDTYNVIALEEATNLKDGSSANRLHESGEDGQELSVQTNGAQMSKENREIAVVKTLCNYFKPDFVKFYLDKQDSPIDVIAEGCDKKEYFQVTRLYDENFWRELHLKKYIDTIIPEIGNLLKNSIERKMCFNKESRTKIILVIDTWPGLLPELATRISKIEAVNKSGFKEIWLAGLTPEMTYKISPS